MSAGLIGIVVASYLIGTIPTARIVTRGSGVDPSREGSRNPGASNVYRLAGRAAGATVLVVDMLKGVLPAAFGYAVDGRGLAAACGLAAVVGHVVPATRRFRGGKGVATAGGMALVLWPAVSVVLIVVFVVFALVVRIASVGSIAMAAGLPIGVAATGRPAFEIGVAALVAALVVARHHDNIRRLLRGEERVVPR